MLAFCLENVQIKVQKKKEKKEKKKDELQSQKISSNTQ